MESEMAGHHRAMCVAAMELIADLRNDTVLVQLDSILMHIQQLPTWSARFDEATLRMERGEFDAARAVLDSLENHFDMRAAATAERGRMYDLLDILDAVRDDERTDAELDSAEIDALTSLAADHYDRAAHWAQNILCFHYGLCRPPLTGGGEFLASIPFQEPHTVATPVDVFVMPVPNPARNFVIFHYQLPPDAQGAMIIVRDVHGRQHYRQQVNGAQGQSVWDTRSVPAGAYTVELMSSTQRLAYERLIVQP
ncbi:MAG: T9SS type A sorting domain-containing protein [Flavobacteriales bacterium]|nr:T9SS type A sorting domain-containing protein [Flavobacteriales bacterium]